MIVFTFPSLHFPLPCQSVSRMGAVLFTTVSSALKSVPGTQKLLNESCEWFNYMLLEIHFILPGCWLSKRILTVISTMTMTTGTVNTQHSRCAQSSSKLFSLHPVSSPHTLGGWHIFRMRKLRHRWSKLLAQDHSLGRGGARIRAPGVWLQRLQS